jgi:hypothetical protein
MTLQRLEDFRLMRRGDRSSGEFEVFVEVSPLTRRQLARAPEWTCATHERLFGAHLNGLAGRSSQATLATVNARLDRLQHPPGRAAQPTTRGDWSIGR